MPYEKAANRARSIRYHFLEKRTWHFRNTTPTNTSTQMPGSRSLAKLLVNASERMQLVRRYHRRQRIRLPNETIHTVVHVIVENQVALGDEFPAKAVLLRLMKEGLDRHEAIHAIASVLSEEFFVVMSEQKAGGDLNADYIEKLNSLTADSWRKQAS